MLRQCDFNYTIFFLTAKILTLKSFAVIILIGADNMIKKEALLKKLIDHKDKDKDIIKIITGIRRCGKSRFFQKQEKKA